MALIKCPECGKEISDEAKICPNCGAKSEQKRTTDNIIRIVIGASLLIIGLMLYFNII